MKTDKLKGKMAERGYSQRKCAEAIGISQNAMYQKINEVKGRCFNVVEAQRLCDVLEIDNLEAVDIFLS